MNLVTGASGIVGSNVVWQLLLSNKPVVACKRNTSNLNEVKNLFKIYDANFDNWYSKITWIDLDITDVFAIEEALKQHKITTVYHCAGFVSFSNKKYKQLQNVNEFGTRNIVNACLQFPEIKLCHVSSVAAINNLDYKAELNETVFWKKSGKESYYAISKYNAEREVWRGIEEGLNAVIVNPGVILCAGFLNQSSTKIFSTCKKGNKFFTEGNAGYISAIDVAKCMIALVEKKISNERFILVEGNYSFKEIFSSIQYAFGKKPPTIKATKFILHLGRIAESLRSFFSNNEAIITKAIINSALNKQTYSNQKIKNALNFNFTPVNQVIREVVATHTI